MSGHSKWHSIKHKKGAADAKRGKLFTQLGRAITVAAKGGGDPEFNPSLRTAIEKAKSMNMPNDNIERAIKKGTGEIEGQEIHENRYEGFGPNGTAFIIDTLTDNGNRTVAELRHIFSKNGGNLEGSVAWQFEQKGILFIPNQGNKSNEEDWLLMAIDAGADDVQADGEDLIIVTEPANLHNVKTWVEKEGLKTENAELQMIAKNTVKIASSDMEQLQNFIELLEDHDDVNKVWHNVEFIS